MMRGDGETGLPPEDDHSADRKRREALRKLALYGGLGGAALVGMLTSEKAAAQSVPVPP
jgi:hypothetical protein